MIGCYVAFVIVGSTRIVSKSVYVVSREVQLLVITIHSFSLNNIKKDGEKNYRVLWY